MTETQDFVMSVFEQHPDEWLSPTFVGNQRATGLHSAWASPRCKALVASGYLERNERGHYRLKKARQENKE
jgi:DNA-binding IclR family transcriptional regulator